MKTPIVMNASRAARTGPSNRSSRSKSRSTRKGRTLLRVIPDDLVDTAIEADADAAQLFRILLNVLRNASEALAETGGTVTVTAARDGTATQIDIADNGTGIPEKIRERLFQPFAGTTRVGGSGLGLAIARDLARAHGGDVTLVKSDERGTQFRVTIPDREE